MDAPAAAATPVGAAIAATAGGGAGPVTVAHQAGSGVKLRGERALHCLGRVQVGAWGAGLITTGRKGTGAAAGAPQCGHAVREVLPCQSRSVRPV